MLDSRSIYFDVPQGLRLHGTPCLSDLQKRPSNINIRLSSVSFSLFAHDTMSALLLLHAQLMYACKRKNEVRNIRSELYKESNSTH